MNLALDFGNTRIKAGLFDKGSLRRTEVFSGVGELLVSPLIEDFQQLIICSVTADHEKLLEKIKKKSGVTLFMPDTPVPVSNQYKSALTLGSDRLAAAVGACNFLPATNVLVIDAGTCIKYNFVNAQAQYLGGAISPGIPMRFKAMNHFTERLPLVEPVQGYDKLIGTNSRESLLSGAIVAAACEADGMIDRYKDLYSDLIVVLTGGDADYLAAQLKNSFFAQPNLLLQGLNAILEFNLKK